MGLQMESKTVIINRHATAIEQYGPINLGRDTYMLIAKFATHSKYNEALYKKRYDNSDKFKYNIPIHLIDIYETKKNIQTFEIQSHEEYKNYNYNYRYANCRVLSYIEYENIHYDGIIILDIYLNGNMLFETPLSISTITIN